MSSESARGAVVNRLGPLLVPAALVMVVAALSGFVTASLQQTVAMMLVNMVLVIGLYTFVGNSGVISFGHVAFMGVGAYASALLTIPVEIRQAQLPDLPGAQREFGLIGQTGILTTDTFSIEASSNG